MTCLAIDTAGPVCAAGFFTGMDGRVGRIAAAAEHIGRGHAERLMPMIAEVLAEAEISWDAIDLVAVSAGPGSFTGIRVGVAAARGLALALQVPAVGVDALAAMIEETRVSMDRSPLGSTVVAALDARRGAVYLRAEPRRGEIAVASAVTQLDEAGDVVRRLGAAHVVLVGSGAEAVKAVLGEAVDIRVAPTSDHARLAAIAGLALRGCGTMPPVPLYLREPDARPQVVGAAVAPEVT